MNYASGSVMIISCVWTGSIMAWGQGAVGLRPCQSTSSELIACSTLSCCLTNQLQLSGYLKEIRGSEYGIRNITYSSASYSLLLMLLTLNSAGYHVRYTAHICVGECWSLKTNTNDVDSY
ncbi:hypothetical protein F5X97DRAFT_101420 [Nemania serpens]|nr:hypothetical protein F5X97DRAFT_101420 [Nemania serpens]